MPAFFIELTGEDRVGDELPAFDLPCKMVLQPVRETEDGFRRHLAVGRQPRRGTAPSDLDPAEEIGLGARHLEEAARVELRALAENLRVRVKVHAGAAPVRCGTHGLELRGREAAREALAIKHLAARDLHLEEIGEGVDDAHTDAVQAARGLVDLGVEFAARMQHRHDHFECGFFRELRMRINRNAAPIIGDTYRAVVLKLDLDEARMSRDRLVHRIVDDLGEEMMHRLLVGAPDIHAGTATHGLEPLEHLDRRSRVSLLAGRAIPACRGGALARRLGRRFSGARILALARRFAHRGAPSSKKIAVSHRRAASNFHRTKTFTRAEPIGGLAQCLDSDSLVHYYAMGLSCGRRMA